MPILLNYLSLFRHSWWPRLPHCKREIVWALQVEGCQWVLAPTTRCCTCRRTLACVCRWRGTRRACSSPCMPAPCPSRTPRRPRGSPPRGGRPPGLLQPQQPVPDGGHGDLGTSKQWPRSKLRLIQSTWYQVDKMCNVPHSPWRMSKGKKKCITFYTNFGRYLPRPQTLLFYMCEGQKENWHHFGLFLNLFSAFHLKFLQLCKKPQSYISGTHQLLFPLVKIGVKSYALFLALNHPSGGVWCMLCLVLGKLYNVNVLFSTISHLQHPKNAYLQHLLQLTMHDTMICRLYSVSVYLVLSLRGVSSLVW